MEANVSKSELTGEINVKLYNENIPIVDKYPSLPRNTT